VALAGAAALSWGVLGTGAACGGQPSAGDLWGRPAQSGARDAHAAVVASDSGVSFRGDGTVVFKPRTAMSLHLQTRVGSLLGEMDVLEVGGVTYQRGPMQPKWARSATPAPDPTWEGASGPRVVGEETVAGGRAWHLRASRGRSPVDMWVRMSDGYPLEVVTSSGSGPPFTFRFDRFNSGGEVQAPPAVAVRPPARSLSGGVGATLALDAARITVVSVDGDAVADGHLVQPRPGNRFVVVEVAVENTGGEPISTFLGWRLTDAAGDAWNEALAVREPSFPGGDVAPGESVQGFLTYEVSQGASGLTLSVKLDDDTATFALE
jgi:hypothetical protein